jgi:chromosome segregation ATPase
MSTEVVRQVLPEEWELKRKEIELASYETTLAQRELELATLNAELHLFQARYLKILGGLYSRLDDLEAKIAEKQARLNPKNREAKKRAAEARNQAEESAKEAQSAQQNSRNSKTETQYNFKPTENLKKLYREVAKRIHPDLAADERQRGHHQQLMAEANRAYEEGDEVRLRAILHQWESSPESVPGDECGAKLVRVIRKIAQAKSRLRTIDIEFQKLKESSLYQLKTKVDDSERKGRDLLAEMAVFMSQKIGEAEQRLQNVSWRENAG